MKISSTYISILAITHLQATEPHGFAKDDNQRSVKKEGSFRRVNTFTNRGSFNGMPSYPSPLIVTDKASQNVQITSTSANMFAACLPLPPKKSRRTQRSISTLSTLRDDEVHESQSMTLEQYENMYCNQPRMSEGTSSESKESVFEHDSPGKKAYSGGVSEEPEAPQQQVHESQSMTLEQYENMYCNQPRMSEGTSSESKESVFIHDSPGKKAYSGDVSEEPEAPQQQVKKKLSRWHNLKNSLLKKGKKLVKDMVAP
ncbi:hypothetical protein ABG067_001894 [Albugo candida]